MLRPFGFNNYAVGKWHLTPMHHIGPAGPYDHWPTQRGFDRYYGFMDGAMNQWDPFLTEDNRHVQRPDHEGYHLTDDIVDHASSWVSAQKSLAPEKPFFLYMAFGAGHSPHHVTKERIAEYIPVFEKGWDVTREERIARQKAMGIVPESTVLPPRNPGVRAWDELGSWCGLSALAPLLIVLSITGTTGGAILRRVITLRGRRRENLDFRLALLKPNCGKGLVNCVCGCGIQTIVIVALGVALSGGLGGSLSRGTGFLLLVWVDGRYGTVGSHVKPGLRGDGGLGW